MDWKLNKVKDIECTMDNSGVYTVINRVVDRIFKDGYLQRVVIEIRVDIMSTDDIPLMSFMGEGNAVRKHVIKWLLAYGLDNEPNWISREHASYIGYEIARAQSDEKYIQG